MGGLFAMKVLRKAHLVKRRQIERTKTERRVLSIADHPFIMKLHFAFQSSEKLYLVLDYCPGKFEVETFYTYFLNNIEKRKDKIII